MTNCSICSAISSATEPHVLWGALGIVSIALALLFAAVSPKHRDLLLVLAALMAGGIAVDVVAHGYEH